jgi:hypothetical protein
MLQSVVLIISQQGVIQQSLLSDIAINYLTMNPEKINNVNRERDNGPFEIAKGKNSGQNASSHEKHSKRIY